MQGATPPRPRLALRIGVTGPRAVPAERVQTLVGQVNGILRLVREHVRLLLIDREVASAYEKGGAPNFVLLSPLAEGIDQLVAQSALDEGYCLHVVMPFAQPEYEKDFRDPAVLDRFRSLVTNARLGAIQIDGVRGEDEAASYEAAGRFMVRNCDILLAVWDGEVGRGRGGTEEVIRYAVDRGVPVYWMHVDTDRDPVWVTGTLDLTLRQSQRRAVIAFERYLRHLLQPPSAGDLRPRTLLERVAWLGQRLRDHPLQVYLESIPSPERLFWGAHDAVIGLIAAESRRPGVVPVPANRPPPDYWQEHLQPADRRANAFGKRFRSVYVWLYALTVISVFLAALTPDLPDRRLLDLSTTAIELAALMLLTFMVPARQANEWQQRWQDYRRLAELFRAQQALAPLGETWQGWTAQVANVEQPAPVGRGAWVDGCLLR